MTAGPTMNTLQLSLDTWDLQLDGSGNLIVATPPYSTAQDVASAIRTFLGEVFFDQSLGVPYTQEIFDQIVPLSVLQSGIEDAALAVPGVLTATAVIQVFENREVSGQVLITDSDGNSATVGI